MSLWITPASSVYTRTLPLLSAINDLDTWLMPQCDALAQLLRHRGPRKPRQWSRSVDLGGFSPKDVTVQREDRKLRIIARQENGEDVTEIKRTIELPDSVDAEKLSKSFSRDGVLHLQAPFKEPPAEQKLQERKAQKRPGETSVWDELRDLLRGPDLQSEASGQIVETEGGAKRFKAELSVREFKPEEIRVRQQGDCVLVEAEHREESGGQRMHRRLERLYHLPSGAQLDQVVSKLSHDGRLCIEAPFEAPPAREKPQLKDVPMEVEQLPASAGGDGVAAAARNGV